VSRVGNPQSFDVDQGGRRTQFDTAGGFINPNRPERGRMPQTR